MNFVNFVNFPRYGYFVLSPGLSVLSTNIDRLEVIIGKRDVLFMSLFINNTHFRAVFDIFVNLCELPIFEVHKIQRLNYRKLRDGISTKSGLFGQTICQILRVVRTLRIVIHDKTKYTDPYKFTKFTKFTDQILSLIIIGIFMNKLIINTRFRAVFDVLVYLCELYKAQPVFLCFMVIIQLLNFVNFKIMKFTQVHGFGEVEHGR